MFCGPYVILSTMQAGTTPIFNVFGMTWPSTNRESNPQNLLVDARFPLSSPFTISRGYWRPIHHQGASSGAPTPNLHGVNAKRWGRENGNIKDVRAKAIVWRITEKHYTHFVMCPITGLDISLNIKDFNPMHQEAINDLVIEHKHKVVKINTMNNVPTPWMSSYVHHCRRNRYIHCYDRLSHDGLHPTLGLLKDWAKIFVNFASKLYL